MRKISILLFVFLLSIAWSDITIKGHVKNAMGNSIQNAHAHIATLDGDVYNPNTTTKIDDNGKFNFNMKSGDYYNLFITAPNHIGLTVPIITDEKDISIEINAKLKANQYVDNFDEVKLVGDWNDFKLAKASEMKKQDDGSYFYEVSTDKDEVAYQLFGADKNGHTVNGTMNDRLEYDGGGDYKSIVKTKDGKVRIIFDPDKLIQSDDPAKVDFENNSPLNTIAEIYMKVTSERKKFYDERRNYIKENKSADGFNYDFSKVATYLNEKMGSDNSLVQRYAASGYVTIINLGYKNDNFHKVTDLLSVTDPLWAINSYSLRDIYKKVFGLEKADEIISEEFDNIKSKSVRSKILVMRGIEAKEKDNMQRAADIYNTLTSEYKDNLPDIKWYVEQINPNKAITKGKPVPDFELKLLNSEEMVSRESMLGKYYMIDFWAVWCGPCREEMPKLHEAYNEFKDANFTILSLSFDRTTDVIDKYREETWAMPWLHSFVENGFNNELSKRFEVMGIPKPILVNDEGIIVATETELRGDNLKKTLNKYLNKSM